MSRISSTLVRHRASRLLGLPARIGLFLYGIEFPREVIAGRHLTIAHRGHGIVIHPTTEIGDEVTIYHGVTIGRADVHRAGVESDFGGIKIDSNVILCPGCVIVGGRKRIHIAEGTIVGANAVLNRSTDVGEIWAGVPATCIGLRDDFTTRE